MRWRKERPSEGQSLVEMAFVMPILFIILFGIIDLSYYIFSYGTIYNASRNGAETATKFPPYQEWLDRKGDTTINFRDDPCTNSILESVQSQSLFFEDGIAGATTISYPNGPDTRNLKDRGPIQVTITYQVEPLTPLWNFIPFGNNGVMTINVTTRRSIEQLGHIPSQESIAKGEAYTSDCLAEPE